MIPSKLKLFLLLTFVFISVRIVNELRVRNDSWKDIIVSDARGYYAYLPTVFIYHDWSYDYLKKHEQPIFGYAACDYIRYVNDHPVNQYPIGTALLQAPFFLAAHLYAVLNHAQPDGFSKPYQLSVLCAALFYLFIGLYFTASLLKKFGISEWVIAAVMVLFFFGTNLFHYTVIEPGMSHVYSFTLISIFLYLIKRSIDEGMLKHLVLSAFVMALVVLVRPSNVLVVLLIPFIAGSSDAFVTWIKKRASDYRGTISVIVVFGITIFLQLMVWYVQTGQWVVYSYQDQRFHFDQPHFWQVLFGFRKGLFVYTPVLLVALAGLIPMCKRSAFRFLSFMAFFIIYFYITSCWYSWYYGASFGLRPVIDTYSVYALLLAFLLESVRGSRVMAVISYGLLIVLVVVNQIQAFQYRAYILDWDKMNFVKYKRVFLKTGWQYHGLFWDNVFYDAVEGEQLQSNQTAFTRPVENWQNENQFTTDRFRSSPSSQRLAGDNAISATAMFAASDRIQNLQTLVVKSDFHVWPVNPNDTVYLVVEVDDGSGKAYESQRKPLQNFISLERGKWNHVQAALKLKSIVKAGDMIKTYLYHPDGDSVYLDDFSVSLIDAEIW